MQEEKTIRLGRWKNNEQYKKAGKSFEKARELRKNPTVHELILYKHLNLAGFKGKFKFQWAICGYIADFYFPEVKLVVEVDGPIHKYRKDEDYKRDFRLQARMRCRTVRFTNYQVMSNPKDVVRQIRFAIAQQKKILGIRRLDGLDLSMGKPQ